MGNLAQSYIADAIRAVAPRFGTIKQTNVRDLRASSLNLSGVGRPIEFRYARLTRGRAGDKLVEAPCGRRVRGIDLGRRIVAPAAGLDIGSVAPNVIGTGAVDRIHELRRRCRN